MARSWQYSRYRRAIMQGTMWILLGATVGLAALQTRQRTSTAQISLRMRVYVVGPWRVRVPEDWIPSQPGGNDLEFHEPIDPDARTLAEQGGRELIVEHDKVGRGVTAAAYLAEKLHLDSLPNALTIPMCGQQGLLVTIPALVGDEEGISICAATVLPSGDAVRVMLRVPRRLIPEDVALAGEIASTIAYLPRNNQMAPPGNARKPDHPDTPDDGD